MTKHDQLVLRVTRKLLKEGDNEITIGKKVVSRKKIANQLRKEFPNRIIWVGR